MAPVRTANERDETRKKISTRQIAEAAEEEDEERRKLARGETEEEEGPMRRPRLTLPGGEGGRIFIDKNSLTNKAAEANTICCRWRHD